MKPGRLFIAVVISFLIVGCQKDAATPEHTKEGPVHKIVFFTRTGCPNTPEMRANLDKALLDLKQPGNYEVIDAADLHANDPRTAYGTPTILLNGQDLFGKPTPTEPAEPT